MARLVPVVAFVRAFFAIAERRRLRRAYLARWLSAAWSWPGGKRVLALHPGCVWNGD
jgi:hypothetical protein